jgi:hypothetical protein
VGRTTVTLTCAWCGVEFQRERAWEWLTNEWASRRCYVEGCEEKPVYVITTAAGRQARCVTHARWYLRRGPDIYPAETLR